MARPKVHPMFSSVVIVLAGVLVRIAAWAAGMTNVESFVGGDTPDYWALAEQPLSSYSTLDGALYELGLRRPPGYPILLAIVRWVAGGVAGAALLQALFGVATIAATIALARRLLGMREAALAGWWLALEPLHAIESSILLTEIPFSLALVLSVFAVWKGVNGELSGFGWWASAGLLLALATLIRPITLYLPLLVCPLVAIGGGRRLGSRAGSVGAVVLFVSFALPVGLWMARNASVSGVVTVSTIQGLNLARYRAHGALMEGKGIAAVEAARQIDSLVNARLPAGANPAVRSRVQTSVGIEVILDEPIGYLVSAAKGTLRTLFGPGSTHILSRMSGIPDGQLLGLGIIVLSGTSALAATLLAIGGLVLWARRKTWLPFALIGTPVTYLLAVGAGAEAYSRFRLQMLPLILIAAASAIVAVHDSSRVRRREIEPPVDEPKLLRRPGEPRE
jgi:4-amino-4-deoxy-L-arabinose transferase-like glycosyltransferase